MFINLHESSDAVLEQAAVILFEAAKSVTLHSWPTLQSAREEVEGCLEEESLCIGYIRKNELAGWVALKPLYKNWTWELHPLMIHPHHQNTRIGSKLLYEAEQQVADRGGQNIFVGTDDELNQTSLSGKDLYHCDLLEEIRNIRNLNRHPYGFYLKNGYRIVGVIPDASGPGKPDILMAKRIQ